MQGILTHRPVTLRTRAVLGSLIWDILPQLLSLKWWTGLAGKDRFAREQNALRLMTLLGLSLRLIRQEWTVCLALGLKVLLMVMLQLPPVKVRRMSATLPRDAVVGTVVEVLVRIARPLGTVLFTKVLHAVVLMTLLVLNFRVLRNRWIVVRAEVLQLLLMETLQLQPVKVRRTAATRPFPLLGRKAVLVKDTEATRYKFSTIVTPPAALTKHFPYKTATHHPTTLPP